MTALLPLLGIVALIVAVLAFAGTAVFIGICLLIVRFTDSDDGRGHRDSRRRPPAPARRGGW